MTYASIAMLFLVIGLGLLVLEFFIPSGGLIGLLCLVALVISVWSAKQAWYVSKPAAWYTYLTILFVTVPGSFYGFVKFLQNSDYGDRVLLRGPTAEQVTPYVEEERALEAMVGLIGAAESELCPSGVCRIDGKRLDCLSDGQLVERGSKIRVIGHRGQYPIVRELTADELVAEMHTRESTSASSTTPESEIASNEPPSDTPSDDDIPDPFAEA